jgi:hypothetical protein
MLAGSFFRIKQGNRSEVEKQKNGETLIFYYTFYVCCVY